MQLGIIGLGKMGANMARRLMRAGHSCVAYDTSAEAVGTLAKEGAMGAKDLQALVGALAAPRAVWIMVPADVVDATIDALAPLLAEGDVIIDGGNSHYADDVIRASALEVRGIGYIDAGTSGGVWGLENGYCMMVGGDVAHVARLQPIFDALAPKDGFLHCGPVGSGHFVKMVHNGIEYGMMAAYAEGFNLMKHTGELGFDLDVAKIAEVWRHGSVVRSWLLDLTASALSKDPALAGYKTEVSDSGEGRWTVQAAVDAAVPVPVLSAALFSRFASRGEGEFANRVLSAMRKEFGGHTG